MHVGRGTWEPWTYTHTTKRDENVSFLLSFSFFFFSFFFFFFFAARGLFRTGRGVVETNFLPI